MSKKSLPFWDLLDAFDIIKIVSMLLCVVLAVFALVTSIYRSFSVGLGKTYEIIGTVTDKDIKNDSNKRGKYLVFIDSKDEDYKVLQVTDSLLAMRFDSSDVYAEIREGKTYKFTVRGSRNRLFSWYPNIYDYKEISNGEK